MTPTHSPRTLPAARRPSADQDSNGVRKLPARTRCARGGKGGDCSAGELPHVQLWCAPHAPPCTPARLLTQPRRRTGGCGAAEPVQRPGVACCPGRVRQAARRPRPRGGGQTSVQPAPRHPGRPASDQGARRACPALPGGQGSRRVTAARRCGAHQGGADRLRARLQPAKHVHLRRWRRS